MSISPANNSPGPIKLKLDKKFQPCPLDEGDEAYPNGIFHFNITRLLAFIDAHPEDFPLEHLPVADIPDYGSLLLDEAAVHSADLSRPVLLAEIAPGRYNLIDGHHRVAKASRAGVPTVHARRIACPRHVPFLTTTEAYEKYVVNGYLSGMTPSSAIRSPGHQPPHGNPTANAASSAPRSIPV